MGQKTIKGEKEVIYIIMIFDQGLHLSVVFFSCSQFFVTYTADVYLDYKSKLLPDPYFLNQFVFL